MSAKRWKYNVTNTMRTCFSAEGERLRFPKACLNTASFSGELGSTAKSVTASSSRNVIPIDR